MKTKTPNSKKWLLILILGMFSMNAAKACTVGFTYTFGVNGQVTFNSACHYTGNPQFEWNPGDGSGYTYLYSWDSTYHHTFIANGTYPVVLTLVIDSTVCNVTDTVYVTVTNVTVPCTLSPSFTYSQAAGGVVTLTSTSTGTYAGTKYTWDPGDGSGPVAGGSTFIHTYVYQGNYPVTLTLQDTGTAYCYNTTTGDIDVTTADSNACHLVAGFSYSIGSNGHVTFTNTSTGIYYNLMSNWNFGDGNNASTYNTTYNYVYLANGTYTVTLVNNVSDSTYCTDSISEVINITNVTTPCTLSAGFNVINDTTTGMVQFVSTSTGTNAGTEYFWKTTDSSSYVLGGSSYVAHYGANGTYTAWLIIEDTGSAYCIDSISETVNVSNVDSLHSSFVQTGSSVDTVGHYLYSFASTSTGTNANTMYAWEPGDTTAGDTGLGMTTYSHTYVYPGFHTVTLSIWFASYPIIGHTTGGNDFDKHPIFYQLSTYKLKVDVGVTGIASINGNSSDMKLYPNPNNGIFRLAIDGMDNVSSAQLQITNLLGEVVYQTTASASNGRIIKDVNLQNVANGTYFVRIITPTNVYNTKALINR